MRILHSTLPLAGYRLQHIDFDPATFQAADLLWLPYHASLSGWSRKRQAEHLAGRIAAVYALREVGEKQPPAIGDRRQPRIQRGAQVVQQARQGIGKVFVLAAAETVAAHDDAAAVAVLVVVAGRQRLALRGREQAGDHGVAARVQVGGDAGPVQGVELAHGKSGAGSRWISSLPPARPA